MYSFRNDYSEGAHPSILKALSETNLVQTRGYGLDPYCIRAAETVKEKCAAPEADVHFLVGGTQTNLLVIHACLRSFEAVIAVTTGHINVHETGAIEATGHKVLTTPADDGKMTPAMVEGVLARHSTEHMVSPRMVYISDSTEVGTLYTKAELSALHDCCQRHKLYLFLDGARLGAALTASGNDLALTDLARYTDAFTIGGTKNGALFGEAAVLVNPAIQPDFRSYIKQRGAMFAKGRLLGLQFSALLEDDLYFQLAQHANAAAAKLRTGIAALGYRFAYDSPTNQLFPVFADTLVEQLAERFEFEVEKPMETGFTCIRLVTSWATPDDAVADFLTALQALTV
ncbi:MAG: aminotransferase class I/II-fold pyridoxal phosphate-dependent enzyme [Oscillospiraceae bacterium]